MAKHRPTEYRYTFTGDPVAAAAVLPTGKTMLRILQQKAGYNKQSTRSMRKRVGDAIITVSKHFDQYHLHIDAVPTTRFRIYGYHGFAYRRLSDNEWVLMEISSDASTWTLYTPENNYGDGRYQNITFGFPNIVETSDTYAVTSTHILHSGEVWAPFPFASTAWRYDNRVYVLKNSAGASEVFSRPYVQAGYPSYVLEGPENPDGWRQEFSDPMLFDMGLLSYDVDGSELLAQLKYLIDAKGSGAITELDYDVDLAGFYAKGTVAITEEYNYELYATTRTFVGVGNENREIELGRIIINGVIRPIRMTMTASFSGSYDAAKDGSEHAGLWPSGTVDISSLQTLHHSLWIGDDEYVLNRFNRTREYTASCVQSPVPGASSWSEDTIDGETNEHSYIILIPNIHGMIRIRWFGTQTLTGHAGDDASGFEEIENYTITLELIDLLSGRRLYSLEHQVTGEELIYSFGTQFLLSDLFSFHGASYWLDWDIKAPQQDPGAPGAAWCDSAGPFSPGTSVVERVKELEGYLQGDLVVLYSGRSVDAGVRYPFNFKDKRDEIIRPFLTLGLFSVFMERGVANTWAIEVTNGINIDLENIADARSLFFLPAAPGQVSNDLQVDAELGGPSATDFRVY